MLRLLLVLAALVTLTGCGEERPVAGTVPYNGTRDVLSWDDQLKRALCAVSPDWEECRANVTVHHEGTAPASAVVLAVVDPQSGDLSLAMRGNLNGWGDCDPLTDVQCWIDYSWSVPVYRCTWGDCPPEFESPE